jgi:hypothetical protein
MQIVNHNDEVPKLFLVICEHLCLMSAPLKIDSC